MSRTRRTQAPAKPAVRSRAAATDALWKRLAPLVIDCHRALIQTRDEAELAREICRLLVRRGGYRAAWICLTTDGASRSLRLAARHHARSGSSRTPRIACAEHAQPCCPFANAPAGAATGGRSRPATPSAAPAHGASTTSPAQPVLLPLHEGRETIGMLHLVPEPGSRPDAAELEALRQIAGSIAARVARLRVGWQHRQAKNAVIDTLRRFHASLQATPLVAIQRVDRSGVVRHWNEASTQLYGYPPEQAVDRRLADLLLEGESAAEFERLVGIAWSSGRGTAAVEWEVTGNSDRRRVVCASLIPIREQGRVVDLFCMEVDITDRHRAQTALRDSEARYRQLVDAAPMPVLVHQDGLVRFANAAALDLLGAHQPDELCLRPVASLVHPDAQPRFEELVREGTRHPVELELVRLDGGVVDADVAALRLRWENQPAEQWLIRDRTLTRRMQWELDAARAKLARIFESSPAAILICSLPDLRLLEANPAFWRLLGYDRDELVGRTLGELGLVTDNQAALLPNSRRSPGDGTPNFEVEFATRDGRPRHALVSVDDFDFGDRRCRLLIMIDVTERKQLESDLRESQKLEAMGLLARGVAHDLNNILTVIRGHQSLIPAGSRLAPQARDSLSGIAEAVERASELTRQLLTFSRKRPLEARTVDLNALVSGVAPLLRRLLGSRIELDLRCAPRLAPVCADPGLIEQVILNLAVNARDAMPHGGRLTVTTEVRFVRLPPRHTQPAASPGDYLCLAVHDSGQGIAPEALPRIFEPFFTTKTAAQGTGLGLATVHHIVQQHHGWIEVDSAANRGTTFRIFLPAAGPPAAEPPKPRDTRPAGARRDTILLVEDEAAVRDLTRLVLERAGYRVLTAGDGSTATRLWRRHGRAIRVLIADLVLPGGMDGGELAQRLQAERPDLRVILSTGYGAGLDAGAALALRSTRVLPKPFAPDTLARFVQESLAEA